MSVLLTSFEKCSSSDPMGLFRGAYFPDPLFSCPFFTLSLTLCHLALATDPISTFPSANKCY